MDLIPARPESKSDLRCVIASPSDDVAHVRLIGEIDHSNADWLAELLATVLLAGWTDVRLDMREVGFVDSSGLTVIERHVLEARLTEQRSSIVDPSEPVLRLVGLLGAEWLLDR